MKRVFFTFGGADKLVVTSKNTFSGFTWKAGLLGKRVIVPESLTFEVTTNGQTRTIDRKDVAEHAQRLGLVNVMREKGAGKFVGRRWFRGKFFRGRKK